MTARHGDTRPLHQEKTKTLKHRKLASWDIETHGEKVGDALYGEICYNGICLIIGHKFENESSEPPYFFSDLMTFLVFCIENLQGYYIAAHNGKGYEFNYLKDTLIDFLNNHPTFHVETLHQGDTIIGFDVIEKESHIITRGKNKGQEKITKRIWHFIDTLPLFNMSLRKVADAFCADMPKGEIDWKNEDWNYNNEIHRSYIIRDCEIIIEAYAALEKMLFDLFSSRIGLTAGSTAIKAFKACIPDGYVYYRNNKIVEEFMRKGYRGGLVLPGTTTKPQYNIAMLDVKGAYGYQMLTQKFPVGSPVHTYKYNPGFIGMYKIHVITPENLPFGILPLIDTATYPLGEFDSIATHVEIEYALELGYKIDVYEGYYYEDNEDVFSSFITRCQEIETTIIEQNGKKIAPYKPLAKLLRNSLYGKFCTKTEASRMYLLPMDEQEPENANIIIDSETGYQIPGIYTIMESVDENYIMPIWGALITAYERIFLARRAYALYNAGATSVYGDTDSLAANINAVIAVKNMGLLEETMQYGSWENEGIADTMIVAAPKVYILLDKNNKPIKIRAKGLPFNQINERYPNAFTRKTYEDAVNDRRDDYHFITSNNLRTRLKNPSLPIRLERHRKISLIARSPNWDYDETTGDIRPKRFYYSPLPDLARQQIVCYALTNPVQGIIKSQRQ